MLDLSSWTVEVGALTSLYTVGLLPLTGPTSSWVGFCTQPTAVCAAILISPGPGADILRGVPKSFHSRTRVSAFAGASKDMFRTLHLNPPRPPAWPAAASHRNAASRPQSTRNPSVRSHVRSPVRLGTGAVRRPCYRIPDLHHSKIDIRRVRVFHMRELRSNESMVSKMVS